MPTLACKVTYHGKPFHGFARQKGNLHTVQGELERALELLYRRKVPLVCAGRTDTGVHARGQVVSFEVTPDELEARPSSALVRSLNALTVPEITVPQVGKVPDGFSARFSAKSRRYKYFISDAQTPPLVMRDFAWQLRSCDSLNVEAMNQACKPLIGEHDFKSFCLASSAEGKPTCREVLDLSVYRCDVMGDNLICIDITGSSFLHSMVRTIAGTLVAVGRGLRSPNWTADVLAARSRDAAGEKAPACGLIFWEVDYADELKDGFIPW